MFRLSDVVRRSIVTSFLLCVALLATQSCRGPAQPYDSLWPGVANLRAQFNADAGKVRILLLPAPT